MPIYEFQCETCGHCFEKLVYREDEEQVDCPECGAVRVKKLISSPCASGLGNVFGGSCASGGGGFS